MPVSPNDSAQHASGAKYEYDVTPAATTIPQEMRDRPQWLVWRGEPKPGGKIDKPPYNARTGHKAHHTDSIDWSPFSVVLEASVSGQWAGIGFELSACDPLTGVDIDDCRNPLTGELTAPAERIINLVSGYWEISPSGTGVKGFTRASKPGRKCRATLESGEAIEIYDHGRFFTTTGDVLPGHETIEDGQAGVEALYAELFDTAGPETKPRNGTESPVHPNTLRDDEILAKISSARNGAKFRRLWNGDTSGYGSPSEADVALANLLAFYTTDPAQLDRLMRRSGLVREKWDKRHYGDGRTYLTGTIDEALAFVTEHYSWPAMSRSTPSTSANGEGHHTCDDPACEQRIRELERENARLREQLTEQRDLHSLAMQVQQNPHLKTRANTYLAAVFEYESAKSRDKLTQDGWAPTSRASLGKRAAAAEKTITDHLDKLCDEWDLPLERRVVRVLNSDPDGPDYISQTQIRLRTPVKEALEMAATFTPEKPTNWGGGRVCCKKHPSAQVRITHEARCVECNEVLGQWKTTHSAPTKIADQAARTGSAEIITVNGEILKLQDVISESSPPTVGLTSQEAQNVTSGGDRRKGQNVTSPPRQQD